MHSNDPLVNNQIETVFSALDNRIRTLMGSNLEGGGAISSMHDLYYAIGRLPILACHEQMLYLIISDVGGVPSAYTTCSSSGELLCEVL